MNSPLKCHRATHVMLAVLFTTIIAAGAQAGTVRGRFDRRTSQGTYPAAGIPVTVFRPDIGRSGVSYSGNDGMYYLYNIPPGYYVLEVWLYPNTPPMTFSIQVGSQPFTDIAPIIVP
jgi:hypothetical protein